MALHERGGESSDWEARVRKVGLLLVQEVGTSRHVAKHWLIQKFLVSARIVVCHIVLLIGVVSALQQ